MKTVGIFTHDLYPFKPWGQGRYVYDLVRFLRKTGDVRILTFSPSEGIEDPDHVQIFPGSHRTRGKNLTFSIHLSRVINRLIRRYRLDLVHLQGGPGGLFLFAQPSVPAIYTVHHTYFQQQYYIPAQRWKILLYLLEKQSYARVDRLMADSPSTRRVLLRRYAIAPGCCTTIPVGVDHDAFYPLRSDRIPESLFFIGRLEKRKGIDFLIQALARVVRYRPQIRLYVAGGGRLSRTTRRFISENGLERHLVLLGTIPDAMVNVWYNRVTAVVVPSVFEGFGLAVVEAMACGTPVIATRVDALRDLITHSHNGLLVDYGDTETLGRLVEQLLSEEALQFRLVRHGRQMVAARYNWDKIVTGMLRVYHSLMTDTRTQRPQTINPMAPKGI